ncbi:MAG TPA: hypothetical protein VED87_12365, partial [Methylocystis sp.]|nr:hypothetical protein [Methylocystis sp.]
LADALVEAIASSYWTSRHLQLPLIGRSHGSKVVAVAAWELPSLIRDGAIFFLVGPFGGRGAWGRSGFSPL